jgi:hypothetical protein
MADSPLDKHKHIGSLHSVDSCKESNTIPLRLEHIHEIVLNKRLESVFDVDDANTVNFVNPYLYKEKTPDTMSKRHDSRYVLNKRLKDFFSVVKEIGCKLYYIKSGTTGHTFQGISRDGSTQYAFKVTPFPKRDYYGQRHDIRRPENAELLMIKTLSYFVVNKQTPNINLPITIFDTSIKPFVNLINEGEQFKENKMFKKFVKRYKKKELHNHVSILVSEWANRGDFLAFVRNNYSKFKETHWKAFLFQIISVLAVIQSKYPDFRHNDMKANNILVQKIAPESVFYRQELSGVEYHVPYVGYQLKLWDFDFACIPGTVDNAKVGAKWTSDINVLPEQHRYYDLHYFFNTIVRFFPEMETSSKIPEEVKKFIGRVVPKKYKTGKFVHERGRLLVDDEYTTPDEVLKLDPYFDEYRRTKFTPPDTEYGRSISRARIDTVTRTFKSKPHRGKMRKTGGKRRSVPVSVFDKSEEKVKPKRHVVRKSPTSDLLDQIIDKTRDADSDEDPDLEFCKKLLAEMS